MVENPDKGALSLAARIPAQRSGHAGHVHRSGFAIAAKRPSRRPPPASFGSQSTPAVDCPCYRPPIHSYPHKFRQTTPRHPPRRPHGAVHNSPEVGLRSNRPAFREVERPAFRSATRPTQAATSPPEFSSLLALELGEEAHCYDCCANPFWAPRLTLMPVHEPHGSGLPAVGLPVAPVVVAPRGAHGPIRTNIIEDTWRWS